MKKRIIVMAVAVLGWSLAIAAPAGADAPAVGIALMPSGSGHWVAFADGGVQTHGDAPFFGSVGGQRLNEPVVGIAATPTGRGYWLVASDGGVFTFGDAAYHGGLGSIRLNQPIVGMATTRSGGGYRLVASDGGVFTFGDAGFFGSTGAVRLNRPIVGMAGTGSGDGYWLVASDGGVFTFGDAGFFGSTGAVRLNRPIVGMAGTGSGDGYWLVASDGGIFTFGDAVFAGAGVAGRAVGFAANGPDYSIADADGRVRSFHRTRVALFGDSLSVETNPHLFGLLAEHAKDYRFAGSGGAATCDYLDAMGTSEISWKPEVVVLLFTGNALTPCITDRSGGGPDGQAFDRSAFEAAYLADILAAIEAFGPATDLVLVGPPQTRGASASADLIDDIYRRVADGQANVHYLAPDRLLTANGIYVDQLPCMLIEPCTPGQPVKVRASDGLHLCAPTPTFCFGGLRMGVMIVDHVTQLVEASGRD